MALPTESIRRGAFLQYGLVLVTSWIVFSSYHHSFRPTLAPPEIVHPALKENAETPHISCLPPSICTKSQLDTIRTQLSPEFCVEKSPAPWVQKCSFTQATKCIDSTWLQEHYQHRKGPSNLVGIDIGCNKGFDAIDMARMLSNKKVFDKASWKNVMEHKGTVTNVGCGPQSPQYNISVGAEKRSSRVFCVEPMPLTVDALNYSTTFLNLTGHGFTVSKAAVSRAGGTVAKFPAKVKTKDVAQHAKVEVGTENVGLSTNCDTDTDACEDVPVVSLDEYVSNQVGADGLVNVLTIDVEGYDYDVLLGGRETLARTEYLEFEYNWIGSWAKQSLRECIDYLQSFDFTCYWAGMGKLWRISGCWLDHYDFHTWSNVACVNHRHNAALAERMEHVFLNTLMV